MLAANLSSQQAAGHSCILIGDEDAELLQSSGLLSGSVPMPLVLEQNRLYTRRYWHYEQRLAGQIRQLCQVGYCCNGLDDILDRYFPDLVDETDWQKEAAKKAVKQAFSMITGGPGTGKTSTVVKILGVMLELASRPLHIALAAPTGKAAMRLQESIGSNKAVLPCSEAVKRLIPEKVTTIHHLLGAQPPTPYFRHNASSPLPYDVIAIDEASMIDLALMSKLVDALKPGARLVLLGDKDQLASVESGAVLADLTSALPEHTLELCKSYRFQGEIKALAEAVNRQQGELAWRLLKNGREMTNLLSVDILTFIVSQYREYLQLIDQAAGFATIFAAFNHFQVLCSNRQGGGSVAEINYRVEQRLAELGLIHLQEAQWYAGRPVMVVENNSAMQLYNGDIGLCLPDSESRQLRVCFQRPDGSIKTVLPGRLPKSETVYAMTVHKSQGSEFDRVLLVLSERLSPVLTKELLYTGITRAKKVVTVSASEEIFVDSVKQKVLRTSGLAARLAD